jgi:UDP-GlcNAc:undecaprenyl-phosphate GlcNAc-1-phosphate transferase
MAPCVDPFLFVLPALAGVFTALALGQLLKSGKLPLDRPNERSLHSTPIPRSGGVVAVPVALCLCVAFSSPLPWQIPASCALVFAVSVVDDIRGLSIALRLACHLVASALVVVELVPADWPGTLIVVAILGITWAMSLFNFMDGADGLAGGMALIGFGTFGAAAWIAGDASICAASFIVSGAAGGFLVWNFPPARVFLGDAGSIPFGAMAGALGLVGWSRGLWPAWFPLLVFAPFIVDATVTLARRTLRGEKIWHAHREHYYQRLVRLGWSHRRTAMAEYALMILCAGAALAGLQIEAALHAWLLGVCAATFVILMTLIDHAWQRHAHEA